MIKKGKEKNIKLKRKNEVWVNIESFVQEIDLLFTGRDQLIGILRENLMKIKGLDDNNVKKLIENKKGEFYRISAHPNFIIYSKDDLIKDYSNNKYITQIVNQLPEI